MTIECRIARTLHQSGMPASLKGYHICATAIKLVLEDPNYLNRVTKKLYPEVANMLGTTVSRVERNIRSAIMTSFNRACYDELVEMFHSTVDPNRGVPTNKEYLAMVAEHIRFSIEEEQHE